MRRRLPAAPRRRYAISTNSRTAGGTAVGKPKIRHLAIMTLDPERLARFYEQAFEMTRLTGKGVPGSKAVYMTDGYITLALLENKADGKPSGLNHFGWHVDDQDEIARRMTRLGVRAPAKRPADRPYAETRGTDPDGNNFDLSVQGYGSEDADLTAARKPATV
jgi:catechol 2,3-dioxygenase-like lactoylglutathione lyase family enzyme